MEAPIASFAALLLSCFILVFCPKSPITLSSCLVPALLFPIRSIAVESSTYLSPFSAFISCLGTPIALFSLLVPAQVLISLAFLLPFLVLIPTLLHFTFLLLKTFI